MVYRLCMIIVLIICSGCVSTAKTSIFCKKTLDLDGQPLCGTMDVGVNVELFRDWGK